METHLDAIPILFVESPNGPEGAHAAFRYLEFRFACLKGRKFYATFQYPDGPYRACVVSEEGEDPAKLGLQTGMIASGLYAKGKLDD